MLLRFNDGELKEIKEKSYKLEKEIQLFVESNLSKLLNYDLIASEFTIEDYRIDTLAYDSEENSFKIIEYKNGKNQSLIDQGYTYLNILLKRKADFVLKYNEVKNKNFSIKDFEWNQSRVIFISPHFTDYQIKANNWSNHPMELIQIKKYENNIIEFKKIKNNSTTNIENLGSKSKNKKILNVIKQVKVYNEDDHLQKADEKIKELYYNLKDEALEWNNVEVDVKQKYIAFKLQKNIFDVVVLNKKLKIFINLKLGALDDPKKIARDITNVGHWGNGDYEVTMNDEDDLDYVLTLLKQSWKDKKL